MEQLLHYVWKHKLFPLIGLRTTNNEIVEVIDTGLLNTDAGPDFFNAKIKIDNTLWVGNVEIHEKSTDWFMHKHHLDVNYNNVILHVASTIDTEVQTLSGNNPPQIKLEIPKEVRQNYEELIKNDTYPPCYKIIPSLSTITLHSWMSVLQTERLEQKAEDIVLRVKQMDGSWEDAYFVTLARNYGFGINGEVFEQWAKQFSLQKTVGHHRDNLLQIESFFLGMAGLLDPLSIPERYREEAIKQDYYKQLSSEFSFLSHKFGAKPIPYSLWKFLRLRPQNFPHIKIAQLSYLYFCKKAGLSNIISCENIKELRKILQTEVSKYWQTHYTFGAESTEKKKHLSSSSIDVIIINTIVPILFAYGHYKDNSLLIEKAFSLLDQLNAENNNIVRMWRDVGLKIETAGDSQALIHLKKKYCDSKDCLRCRIGYQYLKRI